MATDAFFAKFAKRFFASHNIIHVAGWGVDIAVTRVSKDKVKNWDSRCELEFWGEVSKGAVLPSS